MEWGKARLEKRVARIKEACPFLASAVLMRGENYIFFRKETTVRALQENASAVYRYIK